MALGIVDAVSTDVLRATAAFTGEQNEPSFKYLLRFFVVKCFV